MEEKAINKKITIGIIALILVVLAIVGATYAYFSTTHSTDEHTVTTGKLSMGFSEGDILNATGLVPIEDSEIKTKAMELPFSVTNTGSEHMKLTIELTNIVMDDELKDTDFRWGIYNEDTNVGLSFGTFKNIGSSTSVTLLRDVIIDAVLDEELDDITKNYILRVWIHNDGAEQNSMQEKSLTGKVKVTGEAIKYTPESCFTFDDSNSYINSYNAETCGTDVVIPKTIGDVPVVGISMNAFNNKGLTNLIIPDTIETVGIMAFAYNKLTHVTVPENVTFKGAPFVNNSLTSIMIPETNSIQQIGAGNFLTSAVIPSSYTSVDGAFTNNSSLSEVVLMDGVTTITQNAFQNTNLTTIEIPKSVRTITGYTFNGNTNLDEIVVRGKTEAPVSFQKDWNCVESELDEETYETVCTKYANVVYRPN